jgi:hypothetical protein
MNSLIINDGYHLCVCGEVIVNGDTAFIDPSGNYFHPACSPIAEPSKVKVNRTNRKALRVAAYRRSVKPEDDPTYWEKVLADLPDPESSGSEEQYSYPDEGADEPLVHTGQRWNGNVLADCRDQLNEMAAHCDRPRVARIMVEITERQILWEERANLYVTWSPDRLKSVEREQTGIPLFSGSDERSSIGLDVINGRLVDKSSDAEGEGDTKV